MDGCIDGLMLDGWIEGWMNDNTNIRVLLLLKGYS